MSSNAGENTSHDVMNTAVGAVDSNEAVSPPESRASSSHDFDASPNKQRKDNSGEAQAIDHENGDNEPDRKRKTPRNATTDEGAQTTRRIRLRETAPRKVELPTICSDGAEIARLQGYIQEVVTEHSSLFPQMVNVLSGSEVRFALRDNEYIELGAGSSGVVYAGYLLREDNTEVRVAIKNFNTTQEHTIDECILEASVMAEACKMAAVPQMYGLVSLDVELGSPFLGLALVSEFIGDEKSFEAVTLTELIQNHYEAISTPLSDHKRVSKLSWYRLALDLTSAMQTLHDQEVILNDFKADNVVIKTDNWGSLKPYLIDFGCARLWGSDLGLGNDYTQEEGQETFPFLAPELFLPDGFCTARSDRFSLGFLFLQLGSVLEMPLFTLVGNCCTTMNHAVRPKMDRINHALRKGVKSAQGRKLRTG